MRFTFPVYVAALVMVAGCASPDREPSGAGRTGQRRAIQQQVRQKVNFVDTITVRRLPTGSCEWSKVTLRLRWGKPGTTTRAENPNEKTCTVLAYNYTTGSGNTPPAVDAFAYMQDFKRPPPRNAVLNFADTFTVGRTPDGNCDWTKTPARRGKPGTSSYLGEALVAKCWGVVYNVTDPPPDSTHLKADTVMLYPP